MTRQAEKALHRLSKTAFQPIDRAILALGEDPRPPECQRLAGRYDNLYRLRVGPWRLAYAVEDERRVVLILEIAPKQQPERYQLEAEIDETLSAETGEAGSAQSEPKSLSLLRQMIEKSFLPRATEDYVQIFDPSTLEDQKREFADFVKRMSHVTRQGRISLLIHEIIAAKLEQGELQTHRGGSAWYLLHTYLGYEQKVRQNLQQRIEAMAMQDKIFQIIPLVEGAIEDDDDRRSGALRHIPGYILVEMILDDDSWYVVKNTPGVTGFTGSEGKPIPLNTAEVDKILEHITGKPEKLELSDINQEKIRLLITGENSATLGKLHQLLASESDIEIVGIVPSDEGFQTAQEREPDIVLTELTLPISPTPQLPETVPPVTWVIVRDVIDYLASFGLGGGGRGELVPLSKELLASTIYRVYLSRSKTPDVDQHWTGKEKARLFYVTESPEIWESHPVHAWLEPEADIEILGTADNDAAACRQVAELKPDLVLKEFRSPEVAFLRPRSLLIIDGVDYLLANSILAGTRESLAIPFSREALLNGIRRALKLRQVAPEDNERWLRRSSQWLGQGKLGRYLELSLSVVDLANSLSFYERLGLKKVDGNEYPYPWAIVSDGTLHLGLHQQTFVSPTLNYFSTFPLRGQTGVSWRTMLLRILDISLDPVEELGDTYGYLSNQRSMTTGFITPEGQQVILADMRHPIKEYTALDYKIPMRKFMTECHAFGELTLRSQDVSASVAYWKRLGFECLAADESPYPWATVSDGKIRLGLHQTTRFSRPTLSYFRADMPERLEHLHQQGFSFISERKDAQGRRIGALIQSPDGQPILLFTGEIKNCGL